MSDYPIFLNLRKKRVLLFGGGSVALRKAKTLIRSGVHLEARSRDFSKSFFSFARKHGLKTRKTEVIPGNLRTFALVIAATSDCVFNRKVSERCERQSVFVNVADDPLRSTFIVPSSIKRGRFQIAISTGGASPHLAKMIRLRLAREFGISYKSLVNRLADERRKMKAVWKSGKKRRFALQKLAQTQMKRFV